MSESPAFLLLYSSVFFSGAKDERSNSSFGWEPRLSIIISWKGPWGSCDCCNATERTYHEDFSMQETWCYCAREWCRSYWGIKNRIVIDVDEFDEKYMLLFCIKLKKISSINERGYTNLEYIKNVKRHQRNRLGTWPRMLCCHLRSRR